MVGVAMLGAAVLAAETSAPDLNLFGPGERPVATLRAEGLAPGSEKELAVSVCDYTYTNEVARIRRRVKVAEDGSWQGEVDLPRGRYGVYLVRPVLGGLTLPKRGTMPEGIFTYGIVPEPASAPIPAEDAFLGLHGEAGVDLRPWLHARGGFGDARTPSSEYFQISNYKIHDCTGEFWRRILDDPSAQADLDRYLSDIASDAVAAGHGLQKRRFYEICWEPELSAPNPESVVKACEIAWKAIRRHDPDALIAAPTLCNSGSIGYLRRLLDAGLAQWMNAFAVHPYIQPVPEADGFVEKLRITRRLLNEAFGRDIPMVATEGGFNLSSSPRDEHEKLASQVRQALIILGEGFLWHLPFYAYDFGADAGDRLDGDYGLCYNPLYPERRWMPGTVFPRPVFAGLAAFGALTEGLRPSCTIEWLGETVLGYAYSSSDDDRCVIALWDWSGGNASVEIPVQAPRVRVADVMGNEHEVETAGGTLLLALSDLPTYVLGASPSLWGTAAQRRLKWSERRFISPKESAPVVIEGVAPRFHGREPGVAVTVRNRTGEKVLAEVSTRIPGVPEARRSLSVSLAPDGMETLAFDFPGFRPDPLAWQSLETAAAPSTGAVFRRSDRLGFLAVPSSFETEDGIRVSLSWTPDALSLAIAVPDSTQTNAWTGWHSWKGDSVQIGLARKALAKRSENDLADTVEQAASELTLALTPDGPQVYRTITWDESRFPSGMSGEGLVTSAEAPLGVRKTPGGYRYRVSIPWRFIGMERATLGDTFRLAILVNDWNLEGRRTERHVFDLKRTPPKNFGIVTLVEE